MSLAIFNQVVSVSAFALPINIVYNGSDCLYTEGPSTVVTYAAAAIYCALILFLGTFRGKNINPRKRFCMFFWVGLLASAAAIQFFFKQLLIISFASSLGTLILFILIENPDSYRDSALGCFNSYAKSVLLKSMWEEGNPFSVFKICVSPSAVSYLSEQERTEVLQGISNILTEDRNLFVFKENETAFTLVSDNREKACERAKTLSDMISSHEGSENHTALLFLDNPYDLENPEEIDELFSFAQEEHRQRNNVFKVIDGETLRMFRLRKLLSEGKENIEGYEAEKKLLASRGRRVKSLEIIDTFASEYTAVCHVDIQSGTMTRYALGPENADHFNIGFKNEMDFGDAYTLFKSGLVYEDDRELFAATCSMAKIRERLDKERAFSAFFRCLLDGETRYCEMRFTRVSDKDGAVSAFILGFADRDEQIRTQKAEELKTRRYNAAIKALSSEYGSIYYADIDANVIIPYICSDRVSEFVGEEVLKDATFESSAEAYVNNIVLEEDRERMGNELTIRNIKEQLKNRQYFTRIYRNEVNHYCEMKCVRAEETENVSGIVIGFAEKDREIRESMEREEKLKAALAGAEEANRSKTEFLFNMSHDIRTPMNAIIGFTDMAIKHVDDKGRVLDSLNKSKQSSSMLLSLINSVLEVSRIESGHATPDEQPGDIYYSFINFESTMQELAAAKDISLSFEFGNVRDRYVYCDFTRCMRVFVNVISNAIKYTREGGCVKVTCEQLGEAEEGVGTYRYVIADNGIGMSEEFQKHIFEKFSREQNSTVSGIQGTGLGMSVCKSFVDLLGGTIECSSVQGKGSTFTIILPFRLQDGQQYTDPITNEIITGGKNSEDENKETDLSGRRVLLVEDNEMNMEIATDILEDEGISVEQAGDGSTAVDILLEKGPDYYDFILMDIQMPIMNGYEATKKIREMYPDAKLPIIALSANAFEEDKRKSIASGMNDHVAKPINLEELRKTMAKCL